MQSCALQECAVEDEGGCGRPVPPIRLDRGEVEYRARSDSENRMLPLDGFVDFIRDQVIAETIIDAIDDNGYLLESPEALLEGLNPPQREAVVHQGGPLLVVAGPDDPTKSDALPRETIAAAEDSFLCSTSAGKS